MAEDQTVVVPEVVPSKADEVRQFIKTKVAASNDKVTEGVKDKLVQIQITARIDQVIGALNKLSTLELEGRKIRPDLVAYDDQGQELGTPGYSKAKSEELKKHREKVDKLTKAIEKALGDDRDYEGLTKALGEK